jgi:hypothetical protein
MRSVAAIIVFISLAAITAAGPLAKLVDGVCVPEDPQVCNIDGVYYACNDVSPTF